MKHAQPTPDRIQAYQAARVRYRPGNHANLFAGKHRLARV